MLTSLYSFVVYRSIKSGLMLDFYCKKFIYKLLYIIFFLYTIMFSEKYFIEYNFLRIIAILNSFRYLNLFSQKNFISFLIGFMWFYFVCLLILSV